MLIIVSSTVAIIIITITTFYLPLVSEVEELHKFDESEKIETFQVK